MLNIDSFTADNITDNQHSKLIKLCEDAYYLQEPAYENYDVNDWQTKPHTLLNLLYYKKRFELFNILNKDNVPIAMSGSYLWKDTPIIGVRTFTHPNYRSGGNWSQAGHIFPTQIDYWENLGYKKVWLTFNEYNHRLINFLKRISEGKASHFGAGIHSPKNLYKDLKWYDDLVEIQYTNQVVAELDIESYRATHSS